MSYKGTIEPGSKRDLALELIRRPKGASNADLQDRLRISNGYAAQTLIALVAAGHAFKGGREKPHRWFGTQAEADAYQPVRHALTISRPKGAAAAQVQRGPAVVPAGLVVQRRDAPQWDERYQVDPKTRVVGGFASLGIGRYLDGAKA